MEMNKIGKVAEDYFRLIAARAGILVHGPEDDERGWDFHIEFPENEHGRFDAKEFFHRAVEASGLVQVKGHTQDKRSRSIRLQHWERFAKDVRPCFFYILLMDDDLNEEAAAIVHVGQDEVEEVFERLAALGPEDIKDFRQKKKVVSWQEEDEIPPGDPDALLDRLRQHVGLDPREYALQKLRWQKQAGFSDGLQSYVTLHIDFGEDTEPIAQARELLMGRDVDLDVIQADIFEKRFGEMVRNVPKESEYLNDNPEPPIPAKDGRLKLEVKNCQRFRAVTYDVEVFSDLPLRVEGLIDEVTFRAVSTCFEFIRKRGSGRFNFLIDNVFESESLHFFAEGGKIVQKLHQGRLVDEHVQAALTIDGSEPAKVSTDPATALEEMPDSVLRLFQAAVNAKKIEAKLDTNGLRCSAVELLHQSQLIRFAAILCDTPGTESVSFSVGVETDSIERGDEVCLTIAPGFRFQDDIVVLAGGMDGEVANIENIDNGHRIFVDDATPVVIAQPRIVADQTADKFAELMNSLTDSVDEWADNRDVQAIEDPSFILDSVPESLTKQ